MLAIRVTRPAGDLRSFIERIEARCDKLIIYQHDESSRPHIHGLITNCQVSTDTLKNYIKTSLGVTSFPKTDWSFVSKDVNEKFITYMSKGRLDPVYSKGYDEHEVNEFRNQWEDKPHKKSVQTRLTYVVKESPIERKQRQSDMVNEIVDTIEKEGIKKSPRDIITVIWRIVVVKNQNVMGRYKLRDYYDSVASRVNHTEWIYEMENFVKFKV